MQPPSRASVRRRQDDTLLLARSGCWVVAPEAAPPVQEVQVMIRRWKAEETVGTLSVAVGGCMEGAGPGPDPRVPIDLAPLPGGASMPLLCGAPLSAVVGDAALPVCDT